MQKIIINAIPQETRIAILDKEQLIELYIEGKQNKRLVGNIIKGRVTRVLPGIEAAFVDIGQKKDAFLYVLDVFNFASIEGGADEVEQEVDDLNEEELSPEGFVRQAAVTPIQEMLKEGQDILVQVAKEPIGTKGARVTSHINLPGRYLVLMPTLEHLGISRRIEDEAERQRLRVLIEALRTGKEGYIVRTVGECKGEEEFRSDIRVLQMLWKQIQTNSQQAVSPGVVFEDFDPVYRAVRDFFNPNVERIIVDTESAYQHCVELLNAIDPMYANRVRLHVKPTPIFEYFGIETAIDKATRQKVWLKSGGYLVIEQTEAFVSIDVNTGKYVGKRNLEETITLTNLEAAKEIARQAALRNLGGIIVIDFIDMENKENQDKVLEALQTAFKNDRARTHIYPFTRLGLVEMTRKRVRRSLLRTVTDACPYCHGTGYVKSKMTVCYEIFRQLQKKLETNEFQDLIVRVNPDVAYILRTDEHKNIADLEQHYQKSISIQADAALHQDQFDIMVY